MKIKHNVLFSLLIFSAVGCDPELTPPAPVDFNTGWFATVPQNMDFLNTEYDDYNMNIHYDGQALDLYYSTNKGSLGNEFDITSRRIEAGVNLDSGEFTFRVIPSNPTYAWKLLPKINTDADEFGPFSFYTDTEDASSARWYFFYASNEPGNFDIRFAWTEVGDREQGGSEPHIVGPFDAEALNTEYDDFYPTIDQERSKIYFSSNRGQGYDVYEITVNFRDLVNQLQQYAAHPVKSPLFSGEYDDKCPYIRGNLMVFASNRKPGFGGYDLWYSEFEKGKWGEPQNFGPEINTGFDEYRPAVEYFQHSNNDLMIFSSDRPGGRGGFDLYCAGIPKMIRK